MNSFHEIQFSAGLWQLMIDHVDFMFPEEGCGLVGGVGNQVTKVIPITNQLHSPKKYLMNAAEQIEAFINFENHQLDLLAIFHSHPTGVETPSDTDINEFAYPGSALIILTPQGKWHARGFLISDQNVGEIILIVA
jgi:proteasome lid subunit RPN8/RPN11